VLLRWPGYDYSSTAPTVTYQLLQKYLLPHLQPPDTTAYETDRDALTAQFDAAEALLKEIQAETAAVRQAVEAQKEMVVKSTAEVDAAVKEMREGEAKTRDELREIRAEVDSVRDMLPKVIPSPLLRPPTTESCFIDD
jgi:peroxin-14